MTIARSIFASAAAAAIALQPAAVMAQDRAPAPVAQAEALGDSPPISILGYIVGIALAVVILVVVLDDDEDEPVSP